MLVVAVLGVGIVLAQSLRIYFVQSAEIARTREEIAHSKELIAKQKDELARWEDPEYVRSQARVRLGWVMPGEIGYRVIGADGKPIDGSESVAQSAEETAGPWFDRMWTSVKVADEPVPTPAPSAKSGPDVIIGASPSPSDPHS